MSGSRGQKIIHKRDHFWRAPRICIGTYPVPKIHNWILRRYCSKNVPLCWWYNYNSSDGVSACRAPLHPSHSPPFDIPVTADLERSNAVFRPNSARIFLCTWRTNAWLGLPCWTCRKTIELNSNICLEPLTVFPNARQRLRAEQGQMGTTKKKINTFLYDSFGALFFWTMFSPACDYQ